MSSTTSNDRLKRWVDDWAAILAPDSVYWCDGSAEEYDRFAAELVESGTFTRLADGDGRRSAGAQQHVDVQLHVGRGDHHHQPRRQDRDGAVVEIW